MTEYWYRVLKSSWGIAIRITCEMTTLQNTNNDSLVKVSDDICLRIAPKSLHLNDEEKSALVKGASLMEKHIIKHVEKRPVLITITDLMFSEVDYQPEGLTAVLMGWICQEIGIAVIAPKVEYDKDKNRYVFDFDGL